MSVQPLFADNTRAESHVEPADPLVIVVDDDPRVRESLYQLMLSAGLRPICFGSTRELLDADVLGEPGCLVLDVRMPGVGGLDLQRQLVATGEPKPIVFLTGHGDIPMTVQAMKAGAVDFLTKPVRDQTLLDAVADAIARDATQREKSARLMLLKSRYATLTTREREVLVEVARGQLNKQIAFTLEISEVTVKLHRSNVMRKMGALSIGELIRSWEALPRSLRGGASH